MTLVLNEMVISTLRHDIDHHEDESDWLRDHFFVVSVHVLAAPAPPTLTPPRPAGQAARARPRLGRPRDEFFALDTAVEHAAEGQQLPNITAVLDIHD